MILPSLQDGGGFSARRVLDLLDCRHFTDTNGKPPRTDFVLCSHLDLEALLTQGVPPEVALRRFFGRYELHQVWHL